MLEFKLTEWFKRLVWREDGEFWVWKLLMLKCWYWKTRNNWNGRLWMDDNNRLTEFYSLIPSLTDWNDWLYDPHNRVNENSSAVYKYRMIYNNFFCVWCCCCWKRKVWFDWWSRPHPLEWTCCILHISAHWPPKSGSDPWWKMTVWLHRRSYGMPQLSTGDQLIYKYKLCVHYQWYIIYLHVESNWNGHFSRSGLFEREMF